MPKIDPHTATTRHQIYLQRVATHEALTFDDFLRESDKIVKDVLGRVNFDTRKDLTKTIAELRERLGVNYDEWTKLLLNDLNELSSAEARFSSEVLKNATIDQTIRLPTAAKVWQSANVIPLQTNTNGESKLLQPFVKDFTSAEVSRINGVIRNGFYTGMTSNTISKSIRGTRVNNFKDGILDISRRAANIIARTSVNHVASTARMMTFEENEDILNGWIFSATLDSKTSTICRHYDGEKFKLGEGPLPPIHISCRSSSIPDIKSEYDIFDTAGTRASIGADGGAQTGKSPYYNWLKTQPAAFQDEILGKKMGQVFRNSGISTDGFRKLTTNNLGEPLTIKQMTAKNPSVFATVDN